MIAGGGWVDFFLWRNYNALVCVCKCVYVPMFCLRIQRTMYSMHIHCVCDREREQPLLMIDRDTGVTQCSKQTPCLLLNLNHPMGDTVVRSPRHCHHLLALEPQWDVPLRGVMG